MYVYTVRDNTSCTGDKSSKTIYLNNAGVSPGLDLDSQSVPAVVWKSLCTAVNLQKCLMALGADDVLMFSAGDSIKVLPHKKTPSSSNPRAQIWPDAICSPERSKVDPAPMNYTSPDMWRVRCCTCMQANGIPLGENGHPPQENAKLCSVYGKKWMCALMHWKYGPLCMVGCLCRKYVPSVWIAMVCQLVKLISRKWPYF